MKKVYISPICEVQYLESEQSFLIHSQQTNTFKTFDEAQEGEPTDWD